MCVEHVRFLTLIASEKKVTNRFDPRCVTAAFHAQLVCANLTILKRFESTTCVWYIRKISEQLQCDFRPSLCNTGLFSFLFFWRNDPSSVIDGRLFIFGSVFFSLNQHVIEHIPIVLRVCVIFFGESLAAFILEGSSSAFRMREAHHVLMLSSAGY